MERQIVFHEVINRHEGHGVKGRIELEGNAGYFVTDNQEQSLKTITDMNVSDSGDLVLTNIKNEKFIYAVVNV